MNADKQTEFTELRHYAALLTDNWLALVLFTVVGGLAAYTADRAKTPLYRAETELVLERGQPSAAPVPDMMVFQPWDDTFIHTHSLILSSDYLVQRAVRSLLDGPAPSAADPGVGGVTNGPPAFGQAPREFDDAAHRTELRRHLRGYPAREIEERLKRRISVGFLPKSRILSLKVESESPVFAAAGARALVSAYTEYISETYASSAQRTFAQLQQQADQAARQLSDVSARLVEHRREAEIATLTNSLAGSLATSNSLAGLVRDRLALSDPKIAELENALAELNRKVQAAAERYKPLHPEMRTLLDQRAVLQEQIARLRSRAGVEWQTKLLTEQHAVKRSLLEQELEATRRVHDLVLGKMKEIDFSRDTTEPTVRVLKTAAVPRLPVYPRKLQDTVLGAVAGLVLGFLVALTRQHSRGQLVSLATCRDVLPLRVLGQIPHMQKRAMDPLLDGRETAEVSTAAEAFRSLRTALTGLMETAPNRIVLVTSADRGEGKTTVVTALALSLAQLGRNVLLVDLDLRKGRLHKVLHTPPAKGMTEWLHGEDVAAQQVAKGLSLMPCGRSTWQASELLSSPRLAAFLDRAAREYDVVLVDSCPLLPVTDAALVARHAALRLLVVRSRHTHSEACRAVAATLEDLGTALHGVVLNDVRAGEFGYYGYYGRYRYRRYYAPV